MTVVSLQYLTPLILTLNCTLLLKTLGEKERAGRGRAGLKWGRDLEIERRGPTDRVGRTWS